MKYKAFISYRSSDCEWANRLFASLAKRGLSADALFLDKKRLAAGEDWEPQLDDALNESQHFVVLWSSEAAAVDGYVNEERKHFELYFHKPATKDPTLLARKLIFILLDQDPPPAARRTHAISDIRDAKLYENGAEAVPNDAWERVVDQVYRALQEKDSAIPVGCFVLASTRARLEMIPPTTSFGNLESLDDTIVEHGLTRDAFLARYGANANEWRPFGRSYTIQAIMETLKDRVNDNLEKSGDSSYNTFRIRWEFPSEAFWGKHWDSVKKEAQRWRGSLVMVIVDPLSVYDRAVAQRLVLVSETLTTGLATFMALGVTPMPPTRTNVRNLLAIEAVKLHELLCEPQLPLLNPRPLGGVNIDDELDMRRFLVTAISQYANALKPPATHPEARVISPSGLT